jgi:hypothetical protein
MNVMRHKSVAVRKPDYDVLKGLCGKEHRGPSQYISLLIKKEVERRAKDRKMTPDAYVKEDTNREKIALVLKYI